MKLLPGAVEMSASRALLQPCGYEHSGQSTFNKAFGACFGGRRHSVK